VEGQAPYVQLGEDLFEWEGATRTLLVASQLSIIHCLDFSTISELEHPRLGFWFCSVLVWRKLIGNV